MGSSSPLCPATRSRSASCGGLWALRLTPFHPWTGVQRSPAELPAGQVDLTGVTSPYSMFNMTYKEEDFDRLLQLSDYNVRNSQGTILQALRTSLRHRAPGARPPGPQT